MSMISSLLVPPQPQGRMGAAPQRLVHRARPACRRIRGDLSRVPDRTGFFQACGRAVGHRPH
eukprot:7734452-Alexandrium_andersonii.AAC.1